MRWLGLVIVVAVLCWFGYSFLVNKSSAKVGGENNTESIVVEGVETKKSEKIEKKGTPVKVLNENLNELESEIKKKDLKKAESLFFEKYKRSTNNKRLRQLGYKLAELALNIGELERSAKIITFVLDEWTKDKIDWDKDIKEWESAKKLLNRIMRKLLFNPGGAWRSRTYEVRRGDSLERIRKIFLRKEGLRVTSGFLAAVNRISPRQLRPGQKLRIPLGKMKIIVEKKSYVLKLFLDEILIKIYRVGLGKNDSTPETVFTVELKQKNPVWWHPEKGPIPYGHPDNPLGDYFIKLKSDKYTGFGIHSVKESERYTIGKNYSMGCIRMYPEDMKELFQLVPTGIIVEVR